MNNMNLEFYNQQLTAIKKKHEAEIKELQRIYALSNNKVKIDDIVEDHYQKIKVTKFSVATSSNGLPCMVYTGLLLKKDNTPTKKQEISNVWGVNLKTINGKNIND